LANSSKATTMASYMIITEKIDSNTYYKYYKAVYYEMIIAAVDSTMREQTKNGFLEFLTSLPISENYWKVVEYPENPYENKSLMLHPHAPRFRFDPVPTIEVPESQYSYSFPEFDEDSINTALLLSMQQRGWKLISFEDKSTRKWTFQYNSIP